MTDKTTKASQAFQNRLLMFIRDESAFGRFYAGNRIAKLFGLSRNRVYRNLRALEAQGKIKNVHGVYALAQNDKNE